MLLALTLSMLFLGSAVLDLLSIAMFPRQPLLVSIYFGEFRMSSASLASLEEVLEILVASVSILKRFLFIIMIFLQGRVLNVFVK